MYVYFTIKENLFPNKYFINFRKIAFAGRSFKHLTLMNLNYFLDFQIFVGRLVVVPSARLPVIFSNTNLLKSFFYLFIFFSKFVVFCLFNHISNIEHNFS